MTGRRSLSVLALVVGLAGCTKEDSLVLLDLRPSGPLGAPVARIRLTAKGWPTRVVDSSLDVAGLRVGYYGPGKGSAVSVTAEALDAVDCVLGSGTATALSLKAGAISAPTTLFIRPQPANGCVPDAGMETDGGGGDDAGTDAETDAPVDAGVDAAEEVGVDAEVDAGADRAVDAGADAADEAGTDAEPDAGGTPDAGAPDADDDASVADAAVD